MSSPGGTPPSDSDAPTQDAPPQDTEQQEDGEWHPEEPDAWGDRPRPRDDWRPESPDTWQRIMAERQKERGFRRPRSGSSRYRDGTSRRTGRSSSARGLDLRRRSRSRSRRRGSSGRSRRRWIKRVVKISLLVGFLLMIGVGVAVADAYYQSYQVYQDVRDVIPRLTSARRAIGSGDLPPVRAFNEISAISDEAAQKIEGARFTLRLTAGLPFVNRPVKAIELAVDAMREESQAATIIRDLLADTLGDPGGEDSESIEAPIYNNRKADIDLIKSLPPRLEQLIVHLKAGDRAIRSLPHIPLLEQLDELRATASAESKRSIELAEGALTGARLLPSFLGADGPRTYFLAMQNNADQRATGGAVLAYALIRANKGKVDLLDGGGITGVDKPFGFDVRLPSEIQWYIDHVKGAYPRIANPNFSPDFQASARAWDILAPLALDQDIDGVIAIDPVLMAQFLGRTSIEIPSFPTPITGENAVSAIENLQYLLPKKRQQAFPGELIGAAWKVLSDPPSLIKAGQRLGVGLRSRRMQIWSEDPAEQSILAELGWDGGVRVGSGDYLYITDSKLLANKVDFYTHPSIEYDVAIQDDGSAKSTVKITLDNRTPEGLPKSVVGPNAYAVNKALIAAYVPRGAELESTKPKGGPPVHTEGDAAVLIRVVKALPDKPGVVQFTYTVPGVVERTASDRVYRLRIQHQPMVNLPALTVRVSFPEGTTVSPPPGWTMDGSRAQYQAELDHDLDLALRF